MRGDFFVSASRTAPLTRGPVASYGFKDCPKPAMDGACRSAETKRLPQCISDISSDGAPAPMKNLR